jgi:isoquinoline 1-oxidoreductase beta subunit
LKKPGDYKLVGQSIRRVDTPAKIDGTAKFSIDVRLPGLRHAMVSACPVFNGRLREVDAAAAMKVAGVRQVVRLPDAVAVIGDTTWAARKGLSALRIRWDEGPNASLSTADLVAQADAALDRDGLVFMHTGDARAAEASAVTRFEAVFRLPMLAHAGLEPLNCTAHVRPQGCEVWCGSQVLGRARQAAADAAGMPVERVVVHNHLLGGGFGRRLEVDFIAQAVKIAQQVDGPVKVVWTREEDIQHDMYRPYYYHRIAAGTDETGMPLAWTHRVAGSSIIARVAKMFPKNLRVVIALGWGELWAQIKGVDTDAVGGAAEPP